MTQDPEGIAFRRQADERGLLLRSPDAEESRFTFDLKDGEILTSTHPTQVRNLLRLAVEVFGPIEAAQRLGRLVARRTDLDGGGSVTWQRADRVHANLNPGAWVRLETWIDDQHLMEEALQLDDGFEDGA